VFSQASHNSKLSAVAPVPGERDILARVGELIADLQPDDVDLLKGLHRIQHEFRYIPREAIPLLAERMATTPAIIYGTIDFYSELRTEHPAEHVVEWCSGPACRLKNSLGIRRALEAELGCVMNTRSPDNRFELRLVQCDGTCELAPLIRYRHRYMGPLLTSDAIGFARQLKGPASGAHAQASTASMGQSESDEGADPESSPGPDHQPTEEPGE
jgi:NADH:ubiquinone oxidoreductase subunit E